MSKEQNKPNWLLIAGIALVIFLLFRQSSSDVDPTPGPSDWATVEKTVEKATEDYAKQLSEDMMKLAVMVDSGKIDSKKELSDAARKLTEESRNEAFLPVGKLDNKYVPDKVDGENRDLLEAYLRAKSRGHEKAFK